MQSRAFCYVDDLIEALARVMETRINFTGPINLANPREFTMPELAEQFRALTGSKAN